MTEAEVWRKLVILELGAMALRETEAGASTSAWTKEVSDLNHMPCTPVCHGVVTLLQNWEVSHLEEGLYQSSTHLGVLPMGCNHGRQC